MSGAGIAPIVDAIGTLARARLLLGALDLAVRSLKEDEQRSALGELTVTIRALVSDAEDQLMDVSTYVRRVAA